MTYIHRELREDHPWITSQSCGPNATAGFKAPPDIPQTANTHTMTVNPIARP